MKRFLGLIVILMMWNGCNGELGSPDTNTGDRTGTVDEPFVIVNVDRNERYKIIEATLVSGETERMIRIEPVRGRPRQIGVTAELTDGETLLYRISVAWDPDNLGRMWISEQTETDVLTASVEPFGDRLVEVYNINGDRFRADYPALDAGIRRRAFAHNRDGWRPEDPLIEEYLDDADRFGVYYSRHIGNSLHNNPDGELLMSMLANEQFVGQAIGGKDAGGPQLLADRRADRICGLAGLCGMFKCSFGGGLLNPLCIACTGTSLTCLVAEVACWIFDCGWD